MKRTEILRRTIQSLAVVGFFGFCQTAAAQTPVVHVFHAHADIGSSDLKWAAHTVSGLDPSAMVSAEGSQLKVRIASGVNGADLLNALNGSGIAYVAINRDRAFTETGMPVRIDTGDPSGDDARYDAAKRAWIEHHPDAYQAACNGSMPETPATKNP